MNGPAAAGAARLGECERGGTAAAATTPAADHDKMAPGYDGT